jgi:hypothetical protein
MHMIRFSLSSRVFSFTALEWLNAFSAQWPRSTPLLLPSCVFTQPVRIHLDACGGCISFHFIRMCLSLSFFSVRTHRFFVFLSFKLMLAPHPYRCIRDYAKLMLTNENTFRGFSTLVSRVFSKSSIGDKGLLQWYCFLFFFILGHRWICFFFHVALSFNFLTYSCHRILWYYRPIGSPTSAFACYPSSSDFGRLGICSRAVGSWPLHPIRARLGLSL